MNERILSSLFLFVHDMNDVSSPFGEIETLSWLSKQVCVRDEGLFITELIGLSPERVLDR